MPGASESQLRLAALGRPLFVLSFSSVVGKIREIDYSDKIVYTDISDEYIRKNSITVDPAGAAARRRTNES